MTIKTQSFGGSGGSPFPLYNPIKISCRSGAYVDQITINDQSAGGNGGSARDTITFSEDEYINSIVIRSGAYVDSFGFTTNKGQTWGPYGGSGGTESRLDNICVVGIGGRSGAYVDRLTIRYLTY